MRSKVQRLQNTNCSQVASEVVCTDASARDIYLNDPEVREALHVGEDIHQWTFCRLDVNCELTTVRKNIVRPVSCVND